MLRYGRLAAWLIESKMLFSQPPQQHGSRDENNREYHGASCCLQENGGRLVLLARSYLQARR